MTTAYPATSANPRSTDDGTPRLIVGHIPATPEGLGPCNECPEVGSIADGVVLVGYRSEPVADLVGQVAVQEAVCLSCLPTLTTLLQGTGVAEVVVEIPSPGHAVNTPVVARLHHERDVLIRHLVVERVWSNVIWAQQRFTYTQQELRRLAAGGTRDPFADVPTFSDEPW